MKRRFYDGQPVICINARVTRRVARLYPNLNWPSEGGRYVVRRYANAGSPHYPAVLLVEITNRVVTYLSGTRDEAGFADFRFAPATDISDITKIAADVDQWMGADHVDEPDQHPTHEKEDA